MPNALVISPTQLDQIVIRSSQIQKSKETNVQTIYDTKFYSDLNIY